MLSYMQNKAQMHLKAYYAGWIEPEGAGQLESERQINAFEW